MTASIAAEALADLDEILACNAEHFGEDYADEYVAFVKAQIDNLATDIPEGGRSNRSRI